MNSEIDLKRVVFFDHSVFAAVARNSFNIVVNTFWRTSRQFPATPQTTLLLLLLLLMPGTIENNTCGKSWG